MPYIGSYTRYARYTNFAIIVFYWTVRCIVLQVFVLMFAVAEKHVLFITMT